MTHTQFDGLFELNPQSGRCPYTTYSQVREEAPLWVERLNAFMVTRYDDVVSVLSDAQTYSSAMASVPASVTPLARKISEDPNASAILRGQLQRRLEISRSAVLLNADPPIHVRQRKLVNKGFTARRIAALEPEVHAIANDLIDTFIDVGQVDLVQEFAIKLPMAVIANILGVPKSMTDTLKWWSDSFAAETGNLNLTHDELEDMFSAVDQFYDYFTSQIADRRVRPRDDLLTDLVRASVSGEEPLTLNEILQMLVQFLIAGNETTTNLLASIMYKLVTDHNLMTRVRHDHKEIRALTEEVLRLEPPVQGLFRIANEDVEIGGTPIPAGSLIWLVYGSANRDRSAYPAADDLDLDGALSRQHLAFGKGEHFCLGAPLARMEAGISIEILLSRLDDIRLDCAPNDVKYLPNVVLHGLKALPLTFRKVV
nr:cytochrome P450 family protein [Rhodococcus sp. JVH1]